MQQWDVSEKLMKTDRLKYLANVFHNQIDDISRMINEVEELDDDQLPFNLLMRLTWMMVDVYGFEPVKEAVDMFMEEVQKTPANIIQ